MQYTKIEDQSEISLKFNVSNLTDEEFQSVGTKGLKNALKNDFINIELILDVNQSNNISNRKIVIPDIGKAANSYDIERYWFGELNRQDNTNEKFAKYGKKFVFYSKGLDEETIKSIFNPLKVSVSWTTSNGEVKEKVYLLGEVIQFK